MSAPLQRGGAPAEINGRHSGTRTRSGCCLVGSNVWPARDRKDIWITVLGDSGFSPTPLSVRLSEMLPEEYSPGTVMEYEIDGTVRGTRSVHLITGEQCAVLSRPPPRR